MKTLLAVLKKEWMETVRSGKLTVLVILSVLFGIMNPAIAKLTPWMMELLSDSLSENGLSVGNITVNALTSWTQFFKNIPLLLVVLVLIYNSIFTKEYQSGTLIPILTKGLPRYKIVLAKFILVFSLWTLCYWLCFLVTYGYNAFYWDNRTVSCLFSAALYWWLFGAGITSVMVFFSTFSSGSTGVLLGTGGYVTAAYTVGLLPHIKEYSPVMLTNSLQLLTASAKPQDCMKAVLVTVLLGTFSVTASVPLFNRKQL